MGEFFDNYLNIPKIVKEKREYKQQMERVKALPEDYAYVFRKIQKHMWMFASGAGYDIMQIHYDLIDLFEAGVAEGKTVLQITGDDVAAFCDDLLRSAKTNTENQREAFNRDIQKKVGR